MAADAGFHDLFQHQIDCTGFQQVDPVISHTGSVPVNANALRLRTSMNTVKLQLVSSRRNSNAQDCQEVASRAVHMSPGGSILHMKYSEPRRSRLHRASSSGRRQACGLVTRGSSARARSEKGCHCTPALTNTASVSALHPTHELSMVVRSSSERCTCPRHCVHGTRPCQCTTVGCKLVCARRHSEVGQGQAW